VGMPPRACFGTTHVSRWPGAILSTARCLIITSTSTGIFCQEAADPASQELIYIYGVFFLVSPVSAVLGVFFER
jgi:hypothetical protein